MANVRTRFLQVILALSFLCFCYSALASEGVGGSGVEVGGVPIAPPSGWAAVVLVGLVVGSWAVRKFSSVSFFHSTGGAAVAGFLSGAIPAVIQVVQENGLSARAIEAAVVGAVFSFVASDNGSNTSDEQKAKVQAMRVDGGTTLPTPPITKVGMLLPFFFVMACFGCAPGTDGLRQACANANVTLTQTTVTGTQLYKLGHELLRENVTKANADATEAKAKTYNDAFDKFVAAMQGITAVKTTVCDAADAIDAGAKKDIPALTAQAGRVIVDAAAALADLQKLIDTSQKTSDVTRLIALAGGLPADRRRAAVL